MDLRYPVLELAGGYRLRQHDGLSERYLLGPCRVARAAASAPSQTHLAKAVQIDPCVGPALARPIASQPKLGSNPGPSGTHLPNLFRRSALNRKAPD